MDLQRLRLLQQMYEAHCLNQQNQIMVAQILVDRQRRHRPRPRGYWVKPWLSRRLNYGHYDHLMRELEVEDVVSFRNFVRMDPAMFREVLQRVGPRIEKYDTCYRKSINPGCRLAITLCFLATGEKYRSLMFGFRVAHNTISVIVRQTCEAILAEYSDKVLQCPHTSDPWKQVAAEFSSRWNFHHTLGAIDGRHVAIRCPKNGGSLYYNYKGFHSIILLARWMPSTSFCGWMLAPMSPVLMPRSSMTVICARALLMAPRIYLVQSHCLVTTVTCHTFSLGMMHSP